MLSVSAPSGNDASALTVSWGTIATSVGWAAGVAVYPGDVVHGDADNVTVIPAHLAAELADLCEAQDDLEAYLAQRVQRGEPRGDGVDARELRGRVAGGARGAVAVPAPRAVGGAPRHVQLESHTTMPIPAWVIS